jgi:mRNA-degrading endonuclease RelE of RelBE toxin-antitoxin system
MVKAVFDPLFKRQFSKINDALVKGKIIKQLEKLKTNPEAGKPMRYGRKGTRELRIPPFRLSYEYSKEEGIIEILALYHKDEQ